MRFLPKLNAICVVLAGTSIGVSSGVSAIANAYPEPLSKPIEGVTGVYPPPSSIDVAVDVVPEIFLQSNSHFGYTDGKIEVRDITTNQLVHVYDPEPGDDQESLPSIKIQLPENLMIEGHTYEISAGRLFTRINQSPWNIGRIDSGLWTFTVAQSESIPAIDIPGIGQLSPYPSQVNVGLSTPLTITFTANTSFNYTDDAKLSLININTGEVIAEFDPEPGDAQENKLSYQLQAALEPNTDYEVQADHLFARINAEPWNIGEIPVGYWQFSTDGDLTNEPIYPGEVLPPEIPEDPEVPAPVSDFPGISALQPAPGSTMVSTSTMPIISFIASATYGYTEGRTISLININSGEIVASFDPEPGDPQERNLTYQIQVDLQPDTDYAVTTEHLFARVNADPWLAGVIPAGAWEFSTDDSITDSPVYPDESQGPGTPNNPDEPNDPDVPGNPGNGGADTDLSWTENIPASRPRLIYTEANFQQARDWYASNPFEPHPTTDPISSRFDPAGNAFKYLLTNDTHYADIAIQGALNATEKMYQQIGGHCDECRWYGEEVIIVYDWLYDYMSQEQKNTLKVKLDETFEYFLDFYWGSAEPKYAENNYFWGYFRNAALWGIANFHESDNAEMFLRRSMGERWDEIALAHFNQDSTSGIPSEGVNYGPTMLNYNIGLQQTLKQYGKDLHAETNWYRNSAWWLMYTSLPKPTYDHPSSVNPSWTWFPYGDADSFWNGDGFKKAGNKQFLKYALSQWDGTGLESYVRTLSNRSAMDEGVPQFIRSFDDGGATSDLATLPEDFFIDGELAYAYTKSSWDEDAAVVNLQLASPYPVGHEHLDSGNWQLWKDGVWASRESPARGQGSNNGQVPGFEGQGIEQVHMPIAHNVLLVDGKGPLFRQEARANVTNVTSEPDYFYATVDLTDAYAADKVSSVNRSFLFIKPLEVLVIFDQAQTKSASDRVSFLAHFQQEPTVSGNHYNVTNRHVQTELVTLLPAQGFSTRVVNEQREHLDNAHRLVIETNSSDILLHAINARTAGMAVLDYQMSEDSQQYTLTISQQGTDVAVVSIDKSTTTITSLKLFDTDGNALERIISQGIETMSPSNDTIQWTNSY
jgi:hypothetical protein